MLNFKSVTSSEPQIRSNPALRQVNEKSGFQKRISTLLEPINNPLPFPTFQIMRDASQNIVSQHPHYAWIRPAHLRAQWLVLGDELPLMMLDPKDTRRLYSIKVPFDKRRVQQIGPIVCEGAWDAQDHVLWIWDVVVWEKQGIWATMPYSRRWDLVKQVVGQILDCGHPMSDAEVRVPEWQSLESLSSQEELDPAMSVEFQPEKPGQRRHVYVVRDDRVKFVPTSHAERKMVSEEKQRGPHPAAQHTSRVPKNVVVANHVAVPVIALAPAQEEKQEQVEENASNPTDEKQRVGRLKKDPYSKLPDTYRLETATGQDLGLAAIRSFEMSKQLRVAFKDKESLMVDIQWFEPFSKYEVRGVC
jgi:hypothetical protein